MLQRPFPLLFCLLLLAMQVMAQTQTTHIVQGSSVVLTANSENALSYLWFRNGEPINGFHDQQLTVTDAGTYTVMALGNECNSDLSDPVEVIIDPDSNGGNVNVDMQIRNTPDRPTVLIGGLFTYQLFITNNGTHTAEIVTVSATIPQNVSYEGILGNYAGQVFYNPATRELTWLPGDMTAGQSQSLTISVRATSEGHADKLAIVAHSRTDSNPEDNESIASIEVIAMKIPNTFTPNGDGLNDYFRIRGLELFPENRMVIFNRWGNEVYRASPYKGDWNGSNLSEGTYYYVFEVRLPNNHWQTFKGYITLIRNVNK